jgi:hypothetical protein
VSEQDTPLLSTKYLVLRLTKEVNLEKLLRKLKTFQKNHEGNPRWGDLVDILSSAETYKKQTTIGTFLETL